MGDDADLLAQPGVVELIEVDAVQRYPAGLRYV